jgi:nucleolar protein 15
MVKNKRAKVTKTNANRKNVQKETQSKLEEPKPTPQPELSEEEQSENEQLDSSAEESDVSDAEQAALDSKLVEELESSSGEDSSEEEEEEEEEEDDDDDDDEPSQDPFSGGKNKVLLNAEKEEALKQRTDKIKHRRANEPAGTATKPGVIYLGRIPHGFYEDEMRGYFSQFGTVTRLRLSRNKKVRNA